MQSINDLATPQHDALINDVEKAVKALFNGLADGRVPYVRDSRIKTRKTLRGARNTQQTLATLESYATRLEEVEETIKRARETLVARQNTLHNVLSDVDALPDDVLIHIFGWLLTKNEWGSEQRDGALIATHVCSRWRRVALANSSLWSKLDFGWPAEKFKLWSSRTRYHPLDLKLMIIVFPRESEVPATSAFKHIEGLVSQHGDLLRRTNSFTLHIRDPVYNAQKRLLHLLDVFSHLPRPPLTALTILLDTGDRYQPPEVSFPAIRQSLELFLFSSTHTSPSIMRRLALHSVSLPYQMWSSFFDACLNVEYLSLKSVSVSDKLDTVQWPRMKDASQIKVLPHLKMLELHPIDKPFYIFFAYHAQMPSLDVIKAWKHNDPDLFDEMIASLHSVTVLDLEVFGTPSCPTVVSARSAIEAMSNHFLLQELHFTCDWANPGTVENELKKFISHRLVNHPFAPGKALRTLHLRGRTGGDITSWFRGRVHFLKLSPF